MEKGFAYFELCNKEGFFTRGDCKQYQQCIDFAKHIGILRRDIPTARDHFELEIMQLVAMTYICSDMDKFNYDYIVEKVTSIFKEGESND